MSMCRVWVSKATLLLQQVLLRSVWICRLWFYLLIHRFDLCLNIYIYYLQSKGHILVDSFLSINFIFLRNWGWVVTSFLRFDLYKVTYHFDNFVLTRQSRGLDIVIFDIPVAPVDFWDCDGRCQDDQEQWEEETKSEEEDVVRNIFWSGPRRGATHPIHL